MHLEVLGLCANAVTMAMKPQSYLANPKSGFLVQALNVYHYMSQVALLYAQ